MIRCRHCSHANPLTGVATSSTKTNPPSFLLDATLTKQHGHDNYHTKDNHNHHHRGRCQGAAATTAGRSRLPRRTPPRRGTPWLLHRRARLTRGRRVRPLGPLQHRGMCLRPWWILSRDKGNEGELGPFGFFCIDPWYKVIDEERGEVRRGGTGVDRGQGVRCQGGLQHGGV